MNILINKNDSIIYTDEKNYPDKLLRKKKNGQIESIKINYENLEREIIVLEILELAKCQELQKKNILNLNI